MSVNQIKLLTWLGVLGLGGYLAWFVVVDFYQRREELLATVTKERLDSVLGSIQPPAQVKEDIVSYKAVTRVFHTMNWSGRKPEQVVQKAPEEVGPPKPTYKPVKEILKVLYIMVDGGNPAASLAYVHYLQPGMSGARRPGGGLPENVAELHEGDHLPAPNGAVFVKKIEPEAVVFAFDMEGRDDERVEPLEFSAERSLIVKVGPGGAVLPADGPKIPVISTSSAFRPQETTLIRRNTYRLGTEDVAYVSENYAEILTREVRYRRHRDPRTGKYDGIEITEVKPGSLAARHGAQEGDIIKSINGQAVSSSSEAIKFVKSNDDIYDTWEVVVVNKGQERTVTYEEPAK